MIFLVAEITGDERKEVTLKNGSRVMGFGSGKDQTGSEKSRMIDKGFSNKGAEGQIKGVQCGSNLSLPLGRRS